jgi:hypothetical protein
VDDLWQPDQKPGSQRSRPKLFSNPMLLTRNKMGFNLGHRDRATHKGDEYVKMYRLEKWINQCIRCQARGHKLDMPDDIGHNGFAAKYIRSKFRPLSLDQNGLCDLCQKEG